MVRLNNERVLLIGDAQNDVHEAVFRALPEAQIVSVPNIFEGIVELRAGSGYSTILAAVEPIERRPDAAVRTLRALAGSSRLVLFGHPTLEVLARKMLEFGCDDYIITPANSDELQQMFGNPPLRLTHPPVALPADDRAQPAPPALESLTQLPLAEIFLDALLEDPHAATAAAIRQINSRIGPAMELQFAKPAEPSPQTDPQADDARLVLSHVVRSGEEEMGTLYLLIAPEQDDAAARHALTQLAHMMGKTASLQERHNRLQKLAITDELTGLYNARYFRHFLSRIIEKAQAMRFPVTLLLFDIDDFKKYNDQFGHAVGDEILRQTAKLMRRCCREHDLVARIGGDEFAVVFWDKEGPRQPLDSTKPVGASRPPQTPVKVFERFQRLMASDDFTGLGQSGRGRLSVSGGLAVYPYDASDTAGLIKAADEYLMFRAKQAGKNSVFLVNGDENAEAPAE